MLREFPPAPLISCGVHPPRRAFRNLSWFPAFLICKSGSDPLFAFRNPQVFLLFPVPGIRHLGAFFSISMNRGVNLSLARLNDLASNVLNPAIASNSTPPTAK